MSLSQMALMPQKRYMGLTQIDLIIQILLFPLRVPRFLRETPLPLADCADAAERYMGLTQIDLIKQIYYFLLRFLRFLREIPLPLAYGAENLRNPINLCEPITRICGFRDFCEKPPILSQMPQMAQKIFIIELICVSQSPIQGCDCPVVSLRLI